MDGFVSGNGVVNTGEEVELEAFDGANDPSELARVFVRRIRILRLGRAPSCAGGAETASAVHPLSSLPSPLSNILAELVASPSSVTEADLLLRYLIWTFLRDFPDFLSESAGASCDAETPGGLRTYMMGPSGSGFELRTPVDGRGGSLPPSSEGSIVPTLSGGEKLSGDRDHWPSSGSTKSKLPSKLCEELVAYMSVSCSEGDSDSSLGLGGTPKKLSSASSRVTDAVSWGSRVALCKKLRKEFGAD